MEPASREPQAAHNSSPQDDDVIDLMQLVNALRKHKWFVFGCGALVFTLVMGVTLLSSMRFRADARLYLGEIDEGASLADQVLGGGALSGVATEIEILRTRYLVERAVLASGVNARVSRPGWEPPRYWQWRLSGRDPAALDGSDGALRISDADLGQDLAEETAFTVAFTDDKHYRVELDGERLGDGQLGQRFESAAVEFNLVDRPGQASLAGQRFEVTVLPMVEAVDLALGDTLHISAPDSVGGEPVKVLSLDFAAADPTGAARFLAALMRAYLDERQAWKVEEASAAEAFVSGQLQKIEGSLDQTEEKLATFRTENRAVVSESEAAAMVEQLGRYEEQRVAARLEVSALRQLQRSIGKPGAQLEAFMFGETQDAVLQGMAAALSDAKRELAELETKFQDAAPNVKQQRKKVASQQRMVRSYVGSRLSRARANLGQLSRVIGEYEERLKSVPGAELGLAQIGRESEVYGKMYTYLLERQQQTAIQKASTVSKNRVLDMPMVSLLEDSPRLGLRLASGLLGLLLGAFIVVARTLMASTLRDENEVRAQFPGVPVLADIPFRPKAAINGALTDLPSVIDGGVAGFAYTEAYRRLRNNLINRTEGVAAPGLGPVILITSPIPGDGKTTSALSLAVMLAADGKRVLVVDGDVRKPSHHELTGAKLEGGLERYLLEQLPLRRAIQRVPVAQHSFDLLPTLRSCDPDMLSNPRLQRLLVEARSQYDFVLVDSASYPFVSDSLLLAKHVDMVLTVVRIGHTPRRAAEENLRDLSQLNRRIALAVNNSSLVGGTAYPYGATRQQVDDYAYARGMTLPGSPSLQ